jgi:hypothetical protein
MFKDINNDLYRGKLIDIFCDDSGVTHSLVSANKGFWGVFKPKNCYYTIYDSTG